MLHGTTSACWPVHLQKRKTKFSLCQNDEEMTQVASSSIRREQKRTFPACCCILARGAFVVRKAAKLPRNCEKRHSHRLCNETNGTCAGRPTIPAWTNSGQSSIQPRQRHHLMTHFSLADTWIVHGMPLQVILEQEPEGVQCCKEMDPALGLQCPSARAHATSMALQLHAEKCDKLRCLQVVVCAMSFSCTT